MSRQQNSQLNRSKDKQCVHLSLCRGEEHKGKERSCVVVQRLEKKFYFHRSRSDLDALIRSTEVY